MSWEALGAIGEVVGAIAVVLTLAYLAIQVRQNSNALDQQNKVEKAKTVQDRVELVMRYMQLQITSSENLKVMCEVLHDPDWFDRDEHDPLEFMRVQNIPTAYRMYLENCFLQYEEGFLDDDLYYNAILPGIVTYGPIFEKSGMPMTNAFRSEINRILSNDYTGLKNLEPAIAN